MAAVAANTMELTLRVPPNTFFYSKSKQNECTKEQKGSLDSTPFALAAYVESRLKWFSFISLINIIISLTVTTRLLLNCVSYSIDSLEVFQLQSLHAHAFTSREDTLHKGGGGGAIYAHH